VECPDCSPPLFDSVLQIFGDRDPHIRQKLQKAQQRGQPVLIKDGRDAPSRSLLSRLPKSLTQAELTVDKKSLNRFNLSADSWANMKTGSDKLMRRLSRKMKNAKLDDEGSEISAEFGEYLRLVLANKSDAFYFHIMLTRKGDDNVDTKPLVDGLLDSGLMGNTWPTNRSCINQANASMDLCSAEKTEACSIPPLRPHSPRPRYPLFDGDVVDYEVLFLQPPQIGGAHLDDNIGSSYFFLRLIEGQKVVRLWPFFENGALQDWYCAQTDWNIASTPPHLFLGGAYGMGFNHECWGERGFEFGLLNSHLLKEERDTETIQKMCQARQDFVDREPRAGYCFVEVEMGSGDELFVPSSIPHQITTLTPSIAVSANFRFSKLGEMETDDVEELLKDTGMSAVDTKKILAAVETGAEIDSIASSISFADSFKLSAWKRRLAKTPPRGWLKGMLARRSDDEDVIINTMVGTMQRTGDFLEPKPGFDGWPCLREADSDAAEEAEEQERGLEAETDSAEEGDEKVDEEADSTAAEDAEEQESDEGVEESAEVGAQVEERAEELAEDEEGDEGWFHPACGGRC